MPGSHPLMFADCFLTGAGQVGVPFCSKCGRAMGGERDRFGRQVGERGQDKRALCGERVPAGPGIEVLLS